MIKATAKFDVFGFFRLSKLLGSSTSNKIGDSYIPICMLPPLEKLIGADTFALLLKPIVSSKFVIVLRSALEECLNKVANTFF